MNYYKQGDAANADQIRAAFEAKGYHTGLWDYGDELFFFFSMNNGYIRAQRFPASNKDYEACLIDIIKTHPDYQELELPIEPKFKAEDRIVSKSDKSTIYRIITLHEERREYVVEIEHKDYHESCPWIAFEDQDDYELAPKPHYDIANFKPFDNVLTRCRDGWNWECNLFSRYDHRFQSPFITCNGSYPQCIPYNDDTKHLLGTTDMPSEEYINW